MIKKISYSLLLIIPLIFILSGLTVYAGGNTTTTKSTGLKSSQSQNFDVTLPSDVTSINSVKVIKGNSDKESGDYNSCNGTSVGGLGLGSVNSYNLSGNKLKISLSGSAWDEATCDEDYYPKTIKDYLLGSVTLNSSSTRNYSSGGYKGTLQKKTHDSFTATDKRTDEARTASGTSFVNSLTYNKNNYYGTLSKSGSPIRGKQTGGTYQSAHSKEVWGQYSSWYNDGTYSGSLSAYSVVTGSKAVSHMDTSRSYSSGAQCGSVLSPSNYYYNDGIYRGTIYFSHCVENFIGAIPIFYGVFQGTASSYGTRYGGWVSRPEIDTRVYEYTQNYSGTVRKYDYEGTVYKGEWVNKRYNYTVSIDYHYNNAPSINSMTTDNDRYSELPNFNVINLTGRASDPDGDRLTIHYEIANAKGSTSINSGSTFTFNIPIDSKIPEGTHTLRVWADDNDRDDIRTISPVVTKTIIVDKTNPVGNLVEVNGPQSYQVDLDFINQNGAIAGLDGTPYMIDRSINNGNFSTVYGWGVSDRYNDTNLLSNTKYSYRGYIRDIVGHVFQTNWVEIITSPRVDKIGLDPEDSSTIIMELEETIPNGIEIEVKRSGSLIAVIQSGKDFIDPNLDHERQYTYELKAVGTDRFGNRLESVPITVSQWTGVPDIELSLNHPYEKINNNYILERTIFSDKVEIHGDVYYRQGGDVELSYSDKKGNNSTELLLHPYETKPFKLTNYFNEGDTSTITASLLERGFDISDSENIKVNVKDVRVESLNVNRVKIYE